MWSRPEPNTIDPKRTALVVFDMLETYRAGIEASGAIPKAQQLIQLCREQGILICFARADHREDGADFTRVIADVDRDFVPWSDEHPQDIKPKPGTDYRALAELDQRPEDVDILKHRWNAFHGTALDLTLRVQGIDTVMIIGGSTHVGVASTVYSGRDLDYQMIVVKDACTGHKEQRDFFCEQIFPRMVRVRTVDEIGGMIEA